MLKLGTVTGLNLAELNHLHMPRWLEMTVYGVAEVTCICTETSQVVGTAFALNLLIPKLPLDAALFLTMFDALFILAFYSDTGNLRSIRYFELFVCLSRCSSSSFALPPCWARLSAPLNPTWDGFLPSREIFVSDGLFASCAMISGIMPNAPCALTSGLPSVGRGCFITTRSARSRTATRKQPRPTSSTARACGLSNRR